MNLDHFLRNGIARSVLLLSTACGIALQTALMPAWASDQETQTIKPEQLAQAVEPGTDRIDALTKQIIAKETELQRLNTYFKIKGTRQDKWRLWRTFLYAEANANSTGAGLMAAVAERGRNLAENPHHLLVKTTKDGKTTYSYKDTYVKLGKVRLENTQTSQYVGQFIGAAGDATEILLNHYYDYKTKKEGFAPHTTCLLAAKIQNDIDGMMAERAKLIAASDNSGAMKESLVAEGKLLKDMRDLSLKDYIRTYAGVKRLRTQQNTAFSVDFIKNIVGALGIIMGQYSNSRGKPKIVGANGVLTGLSGIFIIATPATALILANIREQIAKHNVRKYIDAGDVKTVGVFDEDRKRLQDLMLNNNLLTAAGAQGTASRTVVYSTEARIITNQESLAEREKRAARRSFVQTQAVATLVGGSKMTIGITNMINGWGHNSARVNDELAFIGALTFGTGSFISAIDAARVRITGEIKTHDQRAKGMLAGQILNQRLADLDTIDKAVKPTVAPVTSSLPGNQSL